MMARTKSESGTTSWKNEKGEVVEHAIILDRSCGIPRHRITLYSADNKKVETKLFDPYSGTKEEVLAKVKAFIQKRYSILDTEDLAKS